jgi:hypothetical protein
MRPSLFLISFFILLLFAGSKTFAQQTVSLGLPEDEVCLIYRNNSSLIRFAYRDIFKQLEQLQKGEWFLSLSSADGERISKVIQDQKMDYERTFKTGSVKRIDATASVQYEPLLLKLIERFIGASLLTNGNAILWRREPLSIQNDIEVVAPGISSSDQRSYFYFPGSKEAFFNGQVLRDPATINDMIDFDMNLSRADSLLANINASVKKNDYKYVAPVYPTGIENFKKYLVSNLKCKSWKKNKGKTFYIQFIIGTDGYIDKDSIKIVNGRSDILDECFEELKTMLLKSERWILPVGNEKLQKFALPLLIN